MSSQIIKVALAIDDRKITLEGPEDFVREEVRRLTGLIESLATPKARESAPAVVSERQMIAEKRPGNQTETVAILAFCLTESGQPEFSEVDMKKAFIRAGVRPPKVVAQALRDAKNNFDLIESGSKRGMYRLSHHGDRTVRFDLPRG